MKQWILILICLFNLKYYILYSQNLDFDTTISIENNQLNIKYSCCFSPNGLFFKFLSFKPYIDFDDKIFEIEYSKNKKIYYGIKFEKDKGPHIVGILNIIYNKKLYKYNIKGELPVTYNNEGIELDNCPIIDLKSNIINNENKQYFNNITTNNYINYFYKKYNIKNTKIEDILINLFYGCELKKNPLIISFKNNKPRVNGKTNKHVIW